MTLALLAALLAAPIRITDVNAARDEQQLEVRVIAAAPLALEGARALLEPGRLLLTLEGATLRGAHDSFHHNHRYVQAEREGGAVRLEVPIGPNVKCEGPAVLSSVADGLVARVACKYERGAGESDAAAEAPAPAPAPVVSAPVVTAPAVKLAAENTSPAKAAPALPAPAPAPAVAKTAAPAEAGSRKPEAPSSNDPFLPANPEPRSNTGPVLAGLLLAALAVAALLLRRRAHPHARRIEILESATLGPRQKIILARIGGETLLLGATDHGITLLTTCAQDDERLDATVTSLPEPGTLRLLAADAAGALLHRLRNPDEKRAAPRASFDAALGEAGEDSELRLKLAAGLSSRTP